MIDDFATLAPIPIEIDAMQIVADLNALGWLDYKIEVACGLSAGYITQVRVGRIKMLSYQRAARLYNFWLSEMTIAKKAVPVIVNTEAVVFGLMTGTTMSS